jgi:hypothetical protein
MSLFLNVEVPGGTSIADAAQETIALANRIGVTVRFDFNGVRCLACPGDDPKRLIEEWGDIISKRTNLSVARGCPTAKERA